MKHKIRVRELVTRPPLPLDPPPPPLCLSLIFYIPGKCCEHWNVTLIATGIISQRKPMDKRDGNEVDRHWRGAFRWRNTGEDCASILIVLYLTLAFNNKRQILNLERRELTMYNLQCTTIQLDNCQSAEKGGCSLKTLAWPTLAHLWEKLLPLWRHLQTVNLLG